MGFGNGGPERVGIAGTIIGRRNDFRAGHRLGDDPGLPRVLSVQAWDVQPIPTATNFFLKETVNLLLPAAAGSSVQTTAPGGGAAQMPASSVASIQAVILFCDAPTLTTVITYTVRANQIPIPGLTNLGFAPQAGANLNLAIPGPWNIYKTGAEIDVLVTRVVADVAKQVNFTIIGWNAPPQDILAWTGVLPGTV